MEHFSLDRYLAQVAGYLREKEAHMSRGRVEQLRALESQSDHELLQRWAWRSAITGAVLSFLAAPVLLAILNPVAPYLIMKLLWAVVQVSMFLTIAMFLAAAYLTVYKRSP